MIDLWYGFYIVKNFEPILEVEISEEQAKKYDVKPGIYSPAWIHEMCAWDALGEDVYYLAPSPGSHGAIPAIFRGEIVWSNIERVDCSEITNETLVFPNIPEGTLLCALVFD